MARFAALILAYLFVGLAFIGVFLPGLPTVPFLLLAAWFAARGSEKLHRWLYAHPTFGQLLIDWEREKAVSRKAKVLAIVMLIASWLFMYWRLGPHWLLLVISITFVTVSIFLITRPLPSRS
ncbi:YbaN family protein [Algiphilus sp.]|uniref:YbaN family protein n=1 Tax=Algiphilus sp. TaxID=1872431 RepID=UPI001CA5FE72|nr:YbaN family protein [Algiphilus sp.]MBY8965395.1 YbaN family protein [Algiphilus acroporae]MCI5063553.1 YbaN family protein [Algiphilus sp.]MCI5102883.1 YbaN family protein [Algiphilus sp.]MCR9091816.1 YbaN family protein [Pseudomonadota bacterium]